MQKYSKPFLQRSNMKKFSKLIGGISPERKAKIGQETDDMLKLIEGDWVAGQGWKLHFPVDNEYSDELSVAIMEEVAHGLFQLKHTLPPFEMTQTKAKEIEAYINGALSGIEGHNISVVYKYLELDDLDTVLVFKVVGE